MCGFVGFLDPAGLSPGGAEAVRAMADRLAHRGPDDDGAWLDPAAGVALAHRRLSILELSPAGAQPMRSSSGRFVLAFNGEIYNHLELRRRLGSADAVWRGHSDTETLLACIERWGVRATLEHSVGMFAFAVWDARERTLTLARDRLGEKPCYYGWSDGVLLFASELKALQPHPAFRPELDRSALALFLRYGYVPAPWTIYRGIAKLTPGTTVTFGLPLAPGAAPEPEAFWSLREVAERGLAQPFDGGAAEATDELERLLADAVALQRVADVPLGAFLSGGIDSSTIAALMQAQAASPVRTFTIGFADQVYDESRYARAVARHLGTDHTELVVTPEEALAALPRMAGVYDEPFGDSSAIPTMLLTALARRHVTVALSGDGGDELFAGYGRYHRVARVWRRIERLPASARRVAAAGFGAAPTRALVSLSTRWRWGTHAHLLPRRVRALELTLRAADVAVPYREVMSLWHDPTALLQGEVDEPPSVLTDARRWLRGGTDLDLMAFSDAESYLPDDVLVKVDRAAMAASLETRVPLLDHRVVAFAWSLPPNLKARDGEGKWLLRQVLDRHVPRALMERPKMGFGVPMDRWLRGELRPWAEALISEERLRADGIFRPEPIRAAWGAHLAGRADWQYHLWPVLAFQAWLETERRGV